MPTYSSTVALLDFAPVLTSAAGYSLLADWVARRRPPWAACAWTGTAMIAAGGLCKATWKLLESLDHQPSAWLGESLLPLIAPGLILLNHGLGEALDRDPAPRQRWSPARGLSGLLATAALVCGAAWATGASSRAGLLGLLAIAIVTSTLLIARSARAAFGAGLPLAALCFAYNGLALYGLGALSRLSPGNRAAWWQETLNLSAQAALAFAAWQLHRHASPSASPTCTGPKRP